MCDNGSGKKITAFLLTFAIGCVFGSFFNSFDSDEYSVQEPLQLRQQIYQNEQKQNLAPKLCKRFETDVYLKLIEERVELKVKLQRSENTSEEKNYRKQLSELDKKIEELRKESRQSKLPKETEPMHNLLYVEKCIEY